MLGQFRVCYFVAFCALVVCASQLLPAQTYTVLHNFTGAADGSTPLAGVTIDPAGNLYGTTSTGRPSYGAVYELKKHNGNFTFNVLHGFDENEAYSPAGRPFRASDGTLYGTTQYGGADGRGAFYHLTPMPTFPRTPLAPWIETILYSFTPDIGVQPQGDLTFDQHGNVYGTTLTGGSNGAGGVYELTHSGNSWSPANLYSASGSEANPYDGVVFDPAGNLWGTFRYGGQYDYGIVFELTFNGTGWNEQTIHQFDPAIDGGYPRGLTTDASGNLYGPTQNGPVTNTIGVVFKITNPGDEFSILSDIPSSNENANCGPHDRVAMDSQGNLYGTTYCGGAHNIGSVFELTPLGGGQWMYTDLHDFDGSDGSFPVSTVTFDSSGNLYGTASEGGTAGCNCGVVWQITP